MARVGLLVMLLAACSDPAVVPDAGVDASRDAPVDEIVVAPVGHDFGRYDVGSGEPPIGFAFEVGNIGTIPATLTMISITGPAAADFTIDANTCGETLAAGDSCNVRVQFLPAAGGERVAALEIIGSTSATAALSGEGLAPPSRIRFSPSARSFGDVPIGGTSATFTFNVLNESSPTTLTAGLVGPGAGGYRIVGTTCTGAALPLGGMCTVMVEMVPPFGGQFLADVTLTEPGGKIWRAGLNGASTTPLKVGPFTGYFGSMLLGQSEPGGRVTFTVTNTGTVATGMINATLIGAAAADFTVRSTTCTMLQPDATCDVVVELTATTRGAKIAQLSVTDAGTEVRSTLRGDAYSLLLVGTEMFPDTVSGQQSAVQTYKVLNASNLAAGPITTTRGGADPTQFSIVGNDCAAGIAPHMSCMIMIRFDPTSTGAKAASLDVAASPGGSDSFVLTGRGL